MPWTPEQRRKYQQTPEERREYMREYSRAWRARNPDKVREQTRRQREYQREYQRAWRARNPEKAKEIQRKSKDRNRDKFNERRRAWRAANPEKARERDRAQRDKDPGRNEHGRWIKEDRAAMWAAQDGKCYLCGKPMDDPRQIRIDHDHSCCPQNKSCRTCRRGLVHHRCNILIGYAEDDPALLRRIADTLEAARLAFKKRQAANASNGLLF